MMGWGEFLFVALFDWLVGSLFPGTRRVAPTNRIYPLDYFQDSGVWHVRFAVENFSEYSFSIAPIVTVTFKTPHGSRDVIFKILESETAVSPSTKQIFTATPRDRNESCDTAWTPCLIHASSKS
jgi:hypothetical protein